MTAMTKEENVRILHGELKGKCNFITSYASTMLACGATCIRIEKNVERISESMNVEVDMTILPRHILLTLWNKEHTNSYSSSQKIINDGIDFDRIIRLSKLSWEISINKLSLKESIKEYDTILNVKRMNKWIVLILTSCANASFCGIFGGDIMAMMIVFVATLMGFLLKQILLEDKWDLRITTIFSAFLASVVGAAGYVFGLSSTPELALGTSVLYLIPGIPYINSVSDLIDGHYICSFGRFMQSLILTICLSLGLCGGFMLMNIKLL